MLWSPRSCSNFQVWLSYQNVSPKICEEVIFWVRCASNSLTILICVSSLFFIFHRYFSCLMVLVILLQIWFPSFGWCGFSGFTQCFSCHSSSIQHFAWDVPSWLHEIIFPNRPGQKSTLPSVSQLNYSLPQLQCDGQINLLLKALLFILMWIKIHMYLNMQ